ncbi:isochorismate synthase [Neorhizobium sp. JUb45]|uniref:isochorismate synthase n=1 Tax=unclassified Neorhizobium TaxID=2629175 RepID=UPI001051BD7B|nr:isochorismate synthase [Neorhizobium sp. JUb45]TCR02727.1 isochorismate synthase [Neorhizobium sp. JUb45]
MQHAPAKTMVAETAPTFLSQADLLDRALFVSPKTRMLASGMAACCDPADGDLRASMDRLFAMARAGGHPPVIIGAIPFDTNAAPSLYVPRQIEEPSLADWQAFGFSPSRYAAPKITDMRQTPSPTDYRRAVAEGVQRIARSPLEKLVLARRLEIELDNQPDVISLLATLMKRHRASFVYSIPLTADGDREAGLLVGASPELLVSKRGNRVFANPLAGTIAADPDPKRNARNIADLMASPKDRHEHAFTSRAVGEALRPFCRSINVPHEPSVLAAGPVNHLSTVIEGELSSTDTGILDLMLALHPTPAVGGVPRAEALAAIADIEHFDRGLYAGMVGWCDENGDGEWAVTLRCAEIRNRNIRLMAGAGIVAGSDPDAEFRETENKFKTMLQALGLDAKAI